jgi:hypothetical protein
MGRIFADWAITFFGHFFENVKSSEKNYYFFYSEKSNALILPKSELCYILGDFLINPSGHAGTWVSHHRNCNFLHKSRRSQGLDH